jgi:hypothetical protein
MRQALSAAHRANAAHLARAAARGRASAASQRFSVARSTLSSRAMRAWLTPAATRITRAVSGEGICRLVRTSSMSVVFAFMPQSSHCRGREIQQTRALDVEHKGRRLMRNNSNTPICCVSCCVCCSDWPCGTATSISNPPRRRVGCLPPGQFPSRCWCGSSTWGTG